MREEVMIKPQKMQKSNKVTGQWMRESKFVTPWFHIPGKLALKLSPSDTKILFQKLR